MSAIPKPPISAVSAAILVALDSVWGAGELGATATVVGTASVPFLSFSLGLLCFLTVTFLQRFIEGDGWGAALAKGLACGVLAGVPLPIMGTGLGAALLGWAGLRGLTKGNAQEEAPKELPPNTRQK
jgi:hypothetical protein